HRRASGTSYRLRRRSPDRPSVALLCRSWMREHPHVHPVSLEDQPLQWRSEDPVPESALLAVANEDLGHSLCSREIEQRRYGLFARKNLDMRADFPSQRQVLFERRGVFSRQARLLNIGDKKIAVEPVSLAAPTSNHDFGIRARSDAHHDSFLSP